MAYSSWSVVFGEQPSAAKWNILGANDASFNNGTGIANLAWDTTALSNPYKFRAYRNAAYVSVSAVPTRMPYDTKSFDTNNNFDVTSFPGRYTVPVSGFYQINANICADHSGFLIIYLFKNGSQISKGSSDYYDPNQFTSVSLADLVQLAASDYIEIVYYIDGASNVEVGSSGMTNFSGYLVSKT